MIVLEIFSSLSFSHSLVKWSDWMLGGLCPCLGASKELEIGGMNSSWEWEQITTKKETQNCRHATSENPLFYLSYIKKLVEWIKYTVVLLWTAIDLYIDTYQPNSVCRAEVKEQSMSLIRDEWKMYISKSGVEKCSCVSWRSLVASLNYSWSW